LTGSRWICWSFRIKFSKQSVAVIFTRNSRFVYNFVLILLIPSILYSKLIQTVQVLTHYDRFNNNCLSGLTHYASLSIWKKHFVSYFSLNPKNINISSSLWTLRWLLFWCYLWIKSFSVPPFSVKDQKSCFVFFFFPRYCYNCVRLPACVMLFEQNPHYCFRDYYYVYRYFGNLYFLQWITARRFFANCWRPLLFMVQKFDQVFFAMLRCLWCLLL